jgi:5-methylcytosine-specific restriction endonuclease McrA
MRNCIDCKADISYKTSNNVKRCEKCLRSKHANRDNISRRGFTIAQVKHRLITLYSGSCAICNWRATDELLKIGGKTFYSFGCELHHIEPASSGGKESLSNLILLCPNHHKQADLGIISKEELRAYQIPEEGVVDSFTLKTKGAELIDAIL